ncbi:MAG: peptide chain release factor 1 [Bacteroidetes bacterium GWC2_33_15]|nr:MAG: peptide chain release factor 1 [Bacteroidetes bacterium GWA2_33_15]OFX50657.1 MAG: peptide chain release factor 1 [Bacteroidetes bacterium GWC2_33_15]OFX63247.1 MAG: peptide chain release factor 1 [Bacteroidetes bacterium GWB2_32_14]OFX69806.1 MAG: peptide chain release factor 1 [Bacteroidetes bacterium GWD2_33_33]HAN19849.1 aminoacyl-tRNA hydrolase [Bacteroidales bacterium]
MNKEQLIKELAFKASRSSGSGGQNVNKVSTKVELRFNIDKSLELNKDEKDRIKLKLKNRISNEEILIITSDSERTQLGNKKKVIELFFELIEKAIKKPKKRLKTKPSKISVEKRLNEKKIQSEKKKNRSLE